MTKEYTHLQKINSTYDLYGHNHDRQIRNRITGEVVADYSVVTGRHKWDIVEGGLEDKVK